MPSIELPRLDSHAIHFEDTVAALFATAGYSVQRRLRLRDPDELLELDTVVTDYSVPEPRVIIVECKSGQRWGYNDLFRLLGRMRFLGVSEGALFARHVPTGRVLDRINRRLLPHNVRCVQLTDDANLINAFLEAGYGNVVDTKLLNVWRYSFALERAIVTYLEKEKKRIAETGGREKGAIELLRYYEVINSEIFFEPNLYSRLRRLYRVWQAHPKLTTGCAREIAGDSFDCETEDRRNPLVRQAIYEGKHDLIQASLFVEHRARIALLKAVVDLIIAGPDPKPVLLIKGAPVFTEWDFLPSNTRQAIGLLKTQSGFTRSPTFWQAFVWAFGGFYLTKRKQREFDLFARATGVTVAEIDETLAIFDLLFPLGDSWLKKSSNSDCRLLMLTPMPFQGIGAFLREQSYSGEDYPNLGYQDMTPRDLAKWHNVGYRWLKDYGDLPISKSVGEE